MKYIHTPRRRILAIHPVSRGFGFVVFEEPHRLIDWGVASCRKRTRTKLGWTYMRSECLDKIGRHLARYQPSLVLMQDCADADSGRCHNTQRFLDSILHFSVKKKVSVRTFSREDIRKAFADFRAMTRPEIASVIANYFPELVPLPKHRDIFIGEDARMSLFSAMSLIFTLFHSEE